MNKDDYKQKAAYRRRVKHEAYERAEWVAKRWAAQYPEDIFPEVDPPTITSAGAKMARLVAGNIARDIRKLVDENLPIDEEDGANGKKK